VGNTLTCLSCGYPNQPQLRHVHYFARCVAECPHIEPLFGLATVN